ncbi:dehydrogenase/reductase SDR family member 9 [Nitrospirota bacterium]|nr:dehydrogenase/reductase SDR family member 9 [Nitrospirota bacterium]
MASALLRQSVVITGASTGIGAACALHLDAMGFQVFAGVRRREDGAALKARGSQRLLPVRLDVTDEVSIAQAAALVKEAVGEEGIAGLVNNAGIAVAGPLEVLPIPELRKQFEVNVIGAVAVTQAFLPLVRIGRGRIVNMGSIAGRATMPFLGPYSMSKFALEAMTTALRLELDTWGSRCRSSSQAQLPRQFGRNRPRPPICSRRRQNMNRCRSMLNILPAFAGRSTRPHSGQFLPMPWLRQWRMP